MPASPTWEIPVAVEPTIEDVVAKLHALEDDLRTIGLGKHADRVASIRLAAGRIPLATATAQLRERMQKNELDLPSPSPEFMAEPIIPKGEN